MSGEPILGKHPADKRDRKGFRWADFVALRDWARMAAGETGYPVYLVGSALRKRRPRDVDVSVVLPLGDYERFYGPIPEPETFWMNRHMHRVFSANAFLAFDAQEAVNWHKRIDVKVTPDSWWPEKDRLLLATP